MESKGMEELLQKYYNGETTIEEERIIKDHLKGKDSNSPDEELISYFNNYKKIIPEPEDLESDISSSLNDFVGRKLMRKKVLNSVVYGIAAGIMLIFVIKTLVIDGDVSINNMSASANISYCIDSTKCEKELYELSQVFTHFSSGNLETIISPDLDKITKSVNGLLNGYLSKDNSEVTFINVASVDKVIDKIYFPNEGIKSYITSADDIYILKIKDDLSEANAFLDELNNIIGSKFNAELENQTCNLYLNTEQERPNQSYHYTIIGDNLLFYLFKN